MRWLGVVFIAVVVAQAQADDGGFVLREPWGAAFDATTGTMVVTNVAGAAWARDGFGFVTEFASDGGVLASKWVSGLNAPKGIAVIEGRVYVADLDTLKIFDRRTAAAAGEVKVLGASSIEGLAAFGSRLYLTDSGLHAVDGGTEKTGTDGVYALETRSTKPLLKTLVKSRGLRNPRSVFVNANGLYVASSTAPLLFTFDLTGRLNGEPVELPHIVTGGVIVRDKQVWLATSHGVLRGTLGGDEWSLVSSSHSGPAAMAFDEANGRLWLPLSARVRDNRYNHPDISNYCSRLHVNGRSF